MTIFQDKTLRMIARVVSLAFACLGFQGVVEPTKMIARAKEYEAFLNGDAE